MDKKSNDKKTDRRSFFRIETNLRLKFQTMEEFRTEYTRNISHEGIFVGTNKPFQIGEIIDVILELPQPRPSMTLMAEVVHAITVQEGEEFVAEPGMGLHFLNLTPTRKKILESYISKEMKQSPNAQGKDRRIHTRTPAWLKVKFASNGALKEKYSCDISKGGILIETDDPAPIDTKIEVMLVHPITGEELKLEGCVVRHVMQNDKPDAIKGMALSFTDFKRRKDEIEGFVNTIRAVGTIKKELSISGKIEDYGMPRLLKTILKSVRAGHVTLKRGDANGLIAFEDESIAHAEIIIPRYPGSGILKVLGEKALFRLLEWEDGQFKFNPEPISGKMHMELESAIKEGAYQAAQLRKNSSKLIPLSARVKPTQKAANVDPPKNLKNILKCIDGPKTVAEILDSCPLPDLSVYNGLAELEKKGFITIKR